jgi:hypothetical protein
LILKHFRACSAWTVHVKTVHILPLAEHAFLACPARDEIGSVHAQDATKPPPRMLSMRTQQFSKMTQESLIKMQISPTKIQNFEKPSRHPSNRTKVKILIKIFGYLSKNLVRVCSVTVEMFEHRNSGEDRRKRSEIFSVNLRRAYKDLIQVKKIQHYIMLEYLQNGCSYFPVMSKTGTPLYSTVT